METRGLLEGDAASVRILYLIVQAGGEAGGDRGTGREAIRSGGGEENHRQSRTLVAECEACIFTRPTYAGRDVQHQARFLDGALEQMYNSGLQRRCDQHRTHMRPEPVEITPASAFFSASHLEPAASVAEATAARAANRSNLSCIFILVSLSLSV